MLARKSAGRRREGSQGRRHLARHQRIRPGRRSAESALGAGRPRREIARAARLDAAQMRDRGRGRRDAATQRGSDYNPFNLLVVSPTGAFVAYNRAGAPDGKIDIVSLKPGLHLLTNLDLDDFECPKISALLSAIRRSWSGDTDFARDPIANRQAISGASSPTILRNSIRASGRPNALCLHLGEYGTRCFESDFHWTIAGRDGAFLRARPALRHESTKPALKPGSISIEDRRPSAAIAKHAIAMAAQARKIDARNGGSITKNNNRADSQREHRRDDRDHDAGSLCVTAASWLIGRPCRQ